MVTGRYSGNCGDEPGGSNDHSEELVMSSRREHGDGSLEERRPGRWRLRWRVGSNRYSRAFTGSKRAAQAELRRLLKSADDGEHIAPDKATLARWSKQWLALLQRRDGEETAPARK